MSIPKVTILPPKISLVKHGKWEGDMRGKKRHVFGVHKVLSYIYTDLLIFLCAWSHSFKFPNFMHFVLVFVCFFYSLPCTKEAPSLPYQCLVFSSQFSICIHYDVMAQHLGLASGQEKPRLILLWNLSCFNNYAS